MSEVYLLSTLTPDVVSLVGAKAARLGTLIQAGLPVPRGFVITALADDDILAPQLQDEIWTAWDALNLQQVAVRSSAIGEDSRQASWAGQFHTSLAVDKKQLFANIQICRDSLRLHQSQVYSRQTATAPISKLAIIIQEMVASQWSGVMFTAHPVTKKRDRIVIEAIFGLGEPIAQGRVSVSHYELAPDGTVLTVDEPGQEESLVLTSDGVQLIDLPHHPPVKLTSLQLQQLLDVGQRVATIFPQPQDIEWAIVDEQVWVVQSRPITTL